MKAVITAQFDSQILANLENQMEIVHTGWGVTEKTLSEEQLITHLKDAEILVTEIERCSKNVIEQCPALIFIGCCRNNPVNIDVEEATRRRIPVVYTPGRNGRAVAEMTVALMIMLARKMGEAIIDVRTGKWTPEARYSYLQYKGFELEGKTVGIAGLGVIGKIVKRLCEAFDMHVIVYDPYLEQSEPRDPTIEFVPMKKLLSEADFVTIHIPDTPETMGMIGKAELETMKETAYLINTARGRHVDEDALYDVLSRQRIAGAALDVFYKEPLPVDHKYFSLENIILLPHVGGATFEVITKHSIIVFEQIQKHLRGEQVGYLRNPEIYAK